jgi:hypothetical protein
MGPSGTLSRMVNLLGTRAPIDDLACLEAESCGRVEARLAVLVELVERERLDDLRAATDSLEGELEELAASPSRISVLALLEAIDSFRRGACDGLLSRADAGAAARRAALLARGDYVCHRPGRSLATGEAEIASRGYYDVEDRPPIASWIAVLAPAAGSSRDCDDIAIVAWIPPADLERARSGCRACPNGALTLLTDLAPEAHRQLRALERNQNA